MQSATVGAKNTLKLKPTAEHLAAMFDDDDALGSRPRRKPSPPKNPRQYALSLLVRREWGAEELRKRLIQKGLDAVVVEDTLAFLQEHGLQSDARFVASRARGLSSRKGNRAIVQDLRQKGVEPELIEAEVSVLDDEHERAKHAARRFEGKMLDESLKAKVWRFLASRGFSSGAIKSALRYIEENAEAGT